MFDTLSIVISRGVRLVSWCQVSPLVAFVCTLTSRFPFVEHESLL